MHTKTLPTYIDRAEARPRAAIGWIALATLLVLGVALLPRVLGLADFFTIDEADHWILRVRLFSEALGQHNWAGTNLTGHPGVATMWLGGLGRRLAIANGIAPSSDSAAYLAMLRLPLAATNALAVAAGYLLLRRIVRPGIALLAAILWATGPSVVLTRRRSSSASCGWLFSTRCRYSLKALARALNGRAFSCCENWPLTKRTLRRER